MFRRFALVPVQLARSFSVAPLKDVLFTSTKVCGIQ
jgi:hypothetical protein